MQRVAIASIFACLVLAAMAGPTWASPEGRDYVVAVRSMPSDRGSYHGEPVSSSNDAVKFLVVRAGNAEAFEKRLAKDPNVVSYEEDLEQYQIALVPTDTHYASYQYSLKPSTTGIESAWDITMGSAAVKVCIVDTGQYRAHQDFAGAHWAEWKDFVGGKQAAYDDNGHGTHVTGTIGAVANNGKGIAGVAQVSLAGAKVLSRTGSGTNSAVANGITWCADIGSDIISLSLGGGFSQAVSNAVTYANSQGSLVVAAAGNAGPCTDCVSYPAKLPLALAVSCTDSLNRQCSFSSEGPEVDLSAPGKDIASTYPNKSPCGKKDTNCYLLMSGTSMSTPHVAGLAALVKSADMSLTADDIRARLISTAQDLGPTGADSDFGAGLIKGSAVQLPALP